MNMLGYSWQQGIQESSPEMIKAGAVGMNWYRFCDLTKVSTIAAGALNKHTTVC